MIIYSGTKSEFIDAIAHGELESTIYEHYYKALHRHPSQGEYQSWMNSYTYIGFIMQDETIPNDAGIAIEYTIPQTSKRIDFLISGYDEDGHPNVVLIELKQWQKLEKVDGPDSLVKTFTGNANREVVHPSYQAWSYAALIKNYNKSVQDNCIGVYPCAYLHNYIINEPDPLLDSQYQNDIKDAPVFCRTDMMKLKDFIKKYVRTGDQNKILYDIDNGKIHPSKSLQDAITGMLKGNQEFIMIDDQKVAYENILQTALQSQKDHVKRTIIVQGGPGTGKSVVAINLLSALTAKGQTVQYASKNSAPRQVYSYKLKGSFKKSNIDNMFKGTDSYTESEDSIIDTILVDEAHRMNAKSGMFQNKGENQIKEVIHASICSVFFIDESQRVTMSDIGSVEEIKHWADQEGSEVSYLELTSQFRCNGSNGYLAWVDDVLEIRETANQTLESIDYDIQVFDSPKEVYEKILEKNNINHRSRMLAGYCWEWDKKSRNDNNAHDIIIGDFEMSWNLGNSVFAIDDHSIDQVGCIHTSQGLEFDYVGLIIGDDMRYKNGHIITDYTERASTDQSLKGIKTLAKKDPDKAYEVADEIIKNTYRTLMTRGMKGCYIYCTDKALSNYLKERLEVK